MSIKVDTSNVKVHWITKNYKQGVILKGQGVLYIWSDGDDPKFGQATKDKYIGMTPEEAVKERYADKSTRSSDIVFTDIIIFELTEGINFDYDDAIRKLVSKFHNADPKKIHFDALYPGKQIDNTNSEALLGFDRNGDLDTLLEITKQYLGINTYFNFREVFSPRFGQDTAIDECVYKLSTIQRALLAAYTAFGKTIVSIEIAHQVIPKGGLVLVTTPIKDTISGFTKELDPDIGKRFGNDPTRKSSIITSKDFINFDGSPKKFVAALKKRANAGELLFILLTVQDLRYQDLKTNQYSAQQRKDIRKKYEALSGHLSLWIRDERHREYEGKITSETFKLLESDMIFDLTATPYKIAELYTPDDIVDRSLSWAILNRHQTKIPEIKIDIMSSAFNSLPLQLQNVYDEEEGWHPKKFFEMSPVGKSFTFTQQQGIVDFAKKSYFSTLRKDKNPLSISNDDELSDVAKRTGMWVLPQGTEEIGSTIYQPLLAKLLNKIDPNVKFIDSYSLEKALKKSVYITLEEYVGNELENCEKFIILTCEKFITGTNIPPLGHIVLLTSIADISKFEQLIGRMIRTYDLKDVVKLYSYCPGMELKNTLAKWDIATATVSQGKQEPGEFLDCISITEYDGTQPVDVNMDDIIKVYQDNMKNISGPPVMSMENTICTDGLAGGFNKKTLLKPNKSSSTKISDDNGSKVKDPRKNPLPAPPVKTPKNTVADDKSVAYNIQTILKEALPFAYSNDVWDPYDVLLLPELALLIDEDNISELLAAMIWSTKLESIIRKWLAEVNISIHNLPIRDVYEKIFVNSEMKRKIGLVYVPFELAEELVDKLPENKYNRILVPNALNGSIPLVLREKYPDADIVCSEVFEYFKPHLIRLGFDVVDWKDIEKDSQLNTKPEFDVIIGNPPYQKGTGNHGGGQTHWNLMVSVTLARLKPKGIMCMIHPGGWRNLSGDFDKIKAELLSYDIISLNINNIEDGQRVFNAATRFDYYCLRKSSTKSFKTKVTDENNQTYLVDLTKENFIPNFSPEKIKGLLAKPGEETVEIMGERSMYGADKPNMAIEQDEEFRYPCIKYIPKSSKDGSNKPIVLRYSNINKGMFGIPKVVFGIGSQVGSIFVDDTGEYGLCQFCYSIVDEPKNLPFIKQALESERFKKLMASVQFTTQAYNYKIIAALRKDFWKEFI